VGSALESSSSRSCCSTSFATRSHDPEETWCPIRDSPDLDQLGRLDRVALGFEDSARRWDYASGETPDRPRLKARPQWLWSVPNLEIREWLWPKEPGITLARSKATPSKEGLLVGNRDSCFLASTFLAGCMLLGPEPVRAGSIQWPSDPMGDTQVGTCDAVKGRYADLARQFAELAEQVASDANREERQVPSQYIPTRRWQAEYNRALLLHRESLEISRLGDAAFQQCSEAVLGVQRQRQSTQGRQRPRGDAYPSRLDQGAPSPEAP
jgi:hypothetical protein